MLVNKSKLTGLTEEQLRTDDSVLGFRFLSVLYYIIQSWNREDSETVGEPRRMKEKGREIVRNAYYGMYHDLHGLAVQIDMIQIIYENKRSITRHKDFLYVQEIVEKYYTNLRSIYDFLANVLNLAVDPRLVGQLPFSSYNDVINAIESGKLEKKLPEEAQRAILSSKRSFLHIRRMRDDIIHNGKQLLAPMTKEDGYYRVEDKEGGTQDQEPLLSYLARLTLDLFHTADELSNVVYNVHVERFGPIPQQYVALIGVCIPTFVQFLGISTQSPPATL